MCTREKYWELDICDESWGSWGGQGAEVSLKTWLSGGEVKVNKNTWYAHHHKTQGRGYSLTADQSVALANLENWKVFKKAWHKQQKPLSWLFEKFKT